MARQEQVFHLRDVEERLGYSQAVRSGSTLYVTGSVSADEQGKPIAIGRMRDQMRNAFEDVHKTLQAFGLTFSNVVKETIYTTNMDEAIFASPVRKEFYKDAAWPATMWLQVPRLLLPEFLVEVDVIAEFNTQ